eukprot:9999160-Lingulodinium_polyedra.AAC.1
MSVAARGRPSWCLVLVLHYLHITMQPSPPQLILAACPVAACCSPPQPFPGGTPSRMVPVA